MVACCAAGTTLDFGLAGIGVICSLAMVALYENSCTFVLRVYPGETVVANFIPFALNSHPFVAMEKHFGKFPPQTRILSY